LAQTRESSGVLQNELRRGRHRSHRKPRDLPADGSAQCLPAGNGRGKLRSKGSATLDRTRRDGEARMGHKQ
jgi:hypothetical protein